MTNLEAKQEAIKKAYGEFWETVKDYVDENGWINCKDIDYFKDCGFMRDQVHYIDNGREWDNFKIIFWRIPSLQGIENNNGWIKIESEADLPKNDDDYWVMTNIKDDEVQQLSNLIVIRCLNLEKNIKVTHYQPIQKPKLPIF